MAYVTRQDLSSNTDSSGAHLCRRMAVSTVLAADDECVVAVLNDEARWIR